MIYIISAAMGILFFGLLAIVLLLKEKNALKRPTLESCGQRPTCRCHGQKSIQHTTDSKCAPAIDKAKTVKSEMRKNQV